MRKVESRQGFVKFWRLGSLDFREQSRWARAPQSRGLWAFPYPFFDLFFAYHQYTDLLPKRLRDGKGELGEESEWVNKVGRKILPVREFWFKGDVFTHFLPNGEVGDTGLFEPEDTEWSRMDVTRMSRFIASSGADKSFERFERDGKPEVSRFPVAVDHLEVFIGPGMGVMRDRL